MPEVLTNDLKTLKNEVKKNNGFNENYFVSGDVLPVSPNALADHKNTKCELAGVKQIRLYKFRHPCASLLINKGANVKIVAKYLGHRRNTKNLCTFIFKFIRLNNRCYR